MSKLACIGIRASGDSLDKMYLALANASRAPKLRSPRMRHLLWEDNGGGALAFHVSRDGIDCVTPFFAAPAPTPWRVSTFGVAADAECDHCSGADCAVLDAAEQTQMVVAVQWLYFAPYEEFLKRPQIFELEVVAFATAVRVYRDAASLRQAEPLPDVAEEHRAELFFATGVAADAACLRERAKVRFGGEVIEVEQCASDLTHEPFVRLRVRASIADVDVVVAPEGVVDADGRGSAAIKPGSWVWIDAWLVGKPTEPPPKYGVTGWLMR